MRKALIDVANLDLVRRDDAAPHVAGEGHGHVYLNGLKLARLYAPRFQIGALPSGTYEVSVALNTNDHRPFVVDDQPVTAAVSVTIDP